MLEYRIAGRMPWPVTVSTVQGVTTARATQGGRALTLTMTAGCGRLTWEKSFADWREGGTTDVACEMAANGLIAWLEHG